MADGAAVSMAWPTADLEEESRNSDTSDDLPAWLDSEESWHESWQAWQDRHGRRPSPGCEGDPPEIRELLFRVDEVNRHEEERNHEKERRALENLSVALRPQQLPAETRRLFVERALARGVVNTAVRLIESGGADLATAASNFLGDFAFNSDLGSQAVLGVFDRIADRFRRIFETLTWEHLALLDAAMLLCVNIAATCPSGHLRLIPLVRPVCLQIIRDPRISDKLRGNTILLLANLSMTVRQELRSLRVADVLLDLVRENRVSEPGKSVAESVVIFLHGDRKCEEIDQLMAQDVVGNYCVPIMELTLQGAEFRGMYPHLLYSARLFQVLAQSEEYAKALASDNRVIPLLLEANRCHGRPVNVRSDLEGRRLALDALRSFVRFGLWPAGCRAAAGRGDGGDGLLGLSTAFLSRDLPLLLSDDHAGIRSSAVALWACFNANIVWSILLVGHRLAQEGRLPDVFWRTKVASCLFPFLIEDVV